MPNVDVPKSAKIEKQFTGHHEGDRLVVTLYTGEASDGFHSGFQRRAARWVVWERHRADCRIMRRASRFGGRNYPKGLTCFAECVVQLKAAGVTEDK